MSEEKIKPDWSFVVLYVAIGIVIGGIFAVPLTAYLINGTVASFEVNGQIGDFVGGLLNPVIALLAFVWLRRGVLAQQQELAETRRPLALQVEISAITTLIEIEKIEGKLLDEQLDRIKSSLVTARDLASKANLSYGLAATTSKVDPWQVVRDLEEQQKTIKVKISQLSARQLNYGPKLRELTPQFNGVEV